MDLRNRWGGRGGAGWWGAGVSAQGGPAWPIPSPSSRQPEKRAGRGGSSRNDLPRLEADRPVCSAERRATGAGEEPGHGVSSIPEPEVPPPEADLLLEAVDSSCD